LTRMAFQWRRKQMQKILRQHPDARLPREVVEGVARLGGWDLSRRPETFSPDALTRMARLLAEGGWSGGGDRVAGKGDPA
jgi:16S rRNA A1518/A1519 N6-dimethyltransferase RsmA/KsgA/DIM1 with predicted DNA glycosylase/AP lyase activity